MYFFRIKRHIVTLEMCIFTINWNLNDPSMKIASKVLSLLLLVMISTFYLGCKKDEKDKKTEEETQLEKLRAVWTLTGATDSNGDRFADFDDPAMVLTLEGNYVEGGTYNFSLTGERPDPSPWPATGTWKFGNNKGSQLIRDPGGVNEIPMDYTVTDSNLILEFTVPEGGGWPGGRIKSVTGDWTFTFTK
jgi:hypothetical protein